MVELKLPTPITQMAVSNLSLYMTGPPESPVQRDYLFKMKDKKILNKNHSTFKSLETTPSGGVHSNEQFHNSEIC